MERLTGRNQYGGAYFKQCFEGPCNGCGCESEDCMREARVCEKLAAYEDTGLSPEAGRMEEEILPDCSIFCELELLRGEG